MNPGSKTEAGKNPDLHRRIEERAYELYMQRGGEPGHALEDWVRAEKEFVKEREAMLDEASEESFPASDPPFFAGR